MRLDFSLRSSCGVSAPSYDLSCVAAAEVRLRDARGETLRTQCTEVTGRYATLNDLVTSPEAVTVLSDVEAAAAVTVELRLYQAVDKPPCTELSEVDLLAWGASVAVDLRDESQEAVTIHLECRPECDCAAIAADPLACPRTLTPGVCAPLEVVRCRRACDTDVCYGSVPCSAGLCTPEANALCADCAAAATCTSGTCVANGSTGEHFCSERCPPRDGAAPCPPGMSCRKPGTAFSALP